MHPRIFKEENKWCKKYNNFNQYLGIDDNNNVFLHFRKIGSFKNILFRFSLKNYPWDPPKPLIINFQDHKKYKRYYEFFNNFNKIQLNELKQLTGIKCLCCVNILCKGNWTPTFTFIKIAEEIKLFYLYKQRIIERITLKIINKKYRFFIDDIKNIIISFI